METRALTPCLWKMAMGVMFLGLAAMIYLHAWVAEDAYITFRVLDNFFHGYGLRWNIHERVQVYTHPLWMLLHIPLYQILPNLFLDTIALSISCTLIAVIVALFTVRRAPWFAIVCLLLPLMLSKSFIDYATSGLENPLSYLLFAVFGHVVLNKHDNPRFWLYCSLVVSLALFNRLDTGVLYFPTLLWLAMSRWRQIRWDHLLLGALPLIGWLSFSLLYYGFLFPNTKYAKLGTDLSLMLYLRQGFNYFTHLMVLDTAGMVLLLSSVLFILFPKRLSAGMPEDLRDFPAYIAMGIYGYSLYVIFIGGDYMAGRFWAVPIFASAWLWYACTPRLRPDMLFLIACVLGGAHFTSPLLKEIRKSCNICIPLKGRVLDGTRTFGRNRLVINWDKPFKIRREGHYPFAKGGRKLARENPPPVKSMWYIGMVGYYAGPKVTIIDELSLADPLLARLPAATRQSFYIGHFRRHIPRGYRHALATGSLKRMPPPLARYYGKLKLITQGNLLDKERLKTILYFNLGMYDHWKQEYLDHGRRRRK